MRKFFLNLFMLSYGVCSMAQSSDPVVMTINGQDILRSEFEYSYKKNNSEGVIDKKSVAEYIDLFINYKLKVAAAYDAKLDTLTSFRNEYAEYRNQVVLPTMLADDDIEAAAKEIYDNTASRIGSDGLFKCSHILLSTNSNNDAAQQEALKNRADSIYNAIKNGANFEELAKQHSQDPGSAKNGGVMSQWFQHGQLVQEFETAALKLQPGEMSEPVLSQFGWHIIRMDERKQFEPYEFHRADILRFIEARNLRDQIARKKIDTEAKEQGVEADALIQQQAAKLSAEDKETKYLLMEYHDGLMLYEISNQEVWEKAAKDEAGQEAFFKKNKNNYNWDTPRFKGIAYHTKTIDDLKAVKKTVKKLDFDKWGDKLKEVFNSDSVIRVRAEKGVFKMGDNALVDSLVFKQDKPAKHVKNYPYQDVCGKIIKKPTDYTDVKGQVVADYQDALEQNWVAELRKRYTFSINEEELKKIQD